MYIMFQHFGSDDECDDELRFYKSSGRGFLEYVFVGEG